MSVQNAHPRLARLFGFLLAFALGVAVLGGTLWFFGTSEPLLESWLDWEAVPEETGLTAEDRAPVAKLVADTMAGREKAFQYKGLFSRQAETHMADCAPLFALARTVGLVGFGVFLAALGGCFFCRNWRGSAVGMLIGVGALALVFGVFQTVKAFRKSKELEAQKASAKAQEEQMKIRETEYTELRDQVIRQIETVAGMSAQEAKNQLMDSMNFTR